MTGGGMTGEWLLSSHFIDWRCEENFSHLAKTTSQKHFTTLFLNQLLPLSRAGVGTKSLGKPNQKHHRAPLTLYAHHVTTVLAHSLWSPRTQILNDQWRMWWGKRWKFLLSGWKGQHIYVDLMFVSGVPSTHIHFPSVYVSCRPIQLSYCRAARKLCNRERNDYIYFYWFWVGKCFYPKRLTIQQLYIKN